MADMNKQVAPGNGRDNAKIVQTAAELEELLDELGEIESFEPPPEFRARAGITDPEVYAAAARDPEVYWAGRARELHWDTPFSTVLDESNAPFVTWFADGTLNVSYNCLDRHVEAGLGDRIAYHWRGEEGEERDITYADLHRDVQRLANGLKDLGVGRGDVVGISSLKASTLSFVSIR
jgi:acetyl-CoA synthetase